MHWMTAKERRSLGQARRKQLGRNQNDEFHAKARKTTALEIVQRSMRGRVAALVKLKYELMAAAPFAYFRGAAPVMAADLSALPSPGIVSQICGDAHVRNLGAYAAPDGRLVFDINDFDETIRGPFEWDLKRMAASLVLAGRAAGHKARSTCDDAVEAFVVRYAEQMRQFAEMPFLEVGRFQVHRIGATKAVLDALAKAERATPQHTLERLTTPTDGMKATPSDSLRKGSAKNDARKDSMAARTYKEMKPMLARATRARAAEVIAALEPYRETLEPQRQHLLSFYRPVDVAFKVVGTGSVGLRDYCIYLEGNGTGDPLFLQIKEETTSAYAAYLPEAHAAQHNGRRAVDGQRAMQIQSDPFLGWTHIGARQYMVRQLNDHKGSIEIGDLAGANLKAYAEVCGELLARGHARSGDPMVISGYIGTGDGFAEALARFGAAYADQTEKDWDELRKWWKGKR